MDEQNMILAREIGELKIVIQKHKLKKREMQKQIVELMQKLNRSHKGFIELVRWIDHVSKWHPEMVSKAVKEYAEGLRKQVPQAFHRKNGKDPRNGGDR